MPTPHYPDYGDPSAPFLRAWATGCFWFFLGLSFGCALTELLR